MDILVIDDDRLMLSMLKMSLERGGHTVRTADRGDDGIKLASESAPDVILLDWHIPGMSGKEVIAKLRKEEKTKKIPVIFFTGKLELGSPADVKKYGAAGLIRKPVIPSNLPKLIEEALSSV